MVIISENKTPSRIRYGSSQFRFAATYVLITFCVLLFLNIYCSGESQRLFYQSKEASMLDKCQLSAAEISGLEILNPTTVSAAVSQMGSLRVTRMVVTDPAGLCIYDSRENGSALGKVILLPETVSALQGNDVFTWRYRDGTMESRAAIPLMSYDALLGCVYIMEYDAEQGALIRSLASNILTITLILEIAVIAFAMIYSGAYSGRIRRIMHSMRIIREGDYTHKVTMGGHDELTVLGDEFNDLTDRLQVSEQKRRQFVSDASHELKTPLASIKLLSDSILQNDMDLDTVRDFVSDIGNEADRLNRMSQKLLSLTRIESQADGECEIVSMGATAERAVHMLHGIAEKSGIRIALNILDTCPVLALEDDLYQIIFNLVENGVKYNVPGGHLAVSVYRNGEYGEISVADTGVGIPEDALAHVFERFYRVDKARSRKTGGSGLGLSIVRSLVERNQGEIHVESTVGVGSTFRVTFPIFDADDTEEAAQ